MPTRPTGQQPEPSRTGVGLAGPGVWRRKRTGREQLADPEPPSTGPGHELQFNQTPPSTAGLLHPRHEHPNAGPGQLKAVDPGEQRHVAEVGQPVRKPGQQIDDHPARRGDQAAGGR